jgi:N-acetylmuramoyl-L-alanine amidase
MKIAGHRLCDCEFAPAHASGGAMVPTLIILHDTAGRTENGSSVNWFKSEDCATSAHAVVERDGAITQMVDFNRRAFHAGASEWKGVTNCNAFSIGIEIVNPGKLDNAGRAWFHKKTEAGFAGARRVKTVAHGDGWWLDYTPEQIEAVTNLCKALVARYPEIEDITTHWTVSPKRKIDTCPLFPLDALRRDVFAARGEGAVAHVEPAEPDVQQHAGTPAGSRKVAIANTGQVAAAGGGLTIFGVALSDALGYGGQFLNLIKTYGPEAVILLSFVAVGAFAMIKHFTKQDFEEGRYTPRGNP